MQQAREQEQKGIQPTPLDSFKHFQESTKRVSGSLEENAIQVPSSILEEVQPFKRLPSKASFLTSSVVVCVISVVTALIAFYQ